MGTIIGIFVLALIAYLIQKQTGLSLTKFVEKKYSEIQTKPNKS